jgi:3-keto-5-aminohexanoate cleavage enzyme
MGHMPSWDPDVAEAVVDAIRAACPGVIINLTTGVVGKDISGPLACMRRVKPEIAACNAGSLNYLKIKEDGEWAWPPMVFDNPVAKVQQFLDVMREAAHPPRVRVLRRRHRAQRGHVPEGRHVRAACPSTTS